MRGSIWTVVAIGVGAAMTPAVLGVDVSGDGTGESTLSLLSSMDVLIGLAFMIACLGLLTVFFGSDGY
jgi:hypothetical protein